jgi:hypothetical protein
VGRGALLRCWRTARHTPPLPPLAAHAQAHAPLNASRSPRARVRAVLALLLKMLSLDACDACRARIRTLLKRSLRTSPASALLRAWLRGIAWPTSCSSCISSMCSGRPYAQSPCAGPLRVYTTGVYAPALGTRARSRHGNLARYCIVLCPLSRIVRCALAVLTILGHRPPHAGVPSCKSYPPAHVERP